MTDFFEDKTIIRICEKILNFFKGDKEKARLWFKTQNLGIGGITPENMIRIGRAEKLEKWIDGQLEGNLP